MSDITNVDASASGSRLYLHLLPTPVLGLICSGIGGEQYVNNRVPVYWVKMFVNRGLTRNHYQKIGIPNQVVFGFGVAMQVVLLKDRA